MKACEIHRKSSKFRWNEPTSYTFLKMKKSIGKYIVGLHTVVQEVPHIKFNNKAEEASKILIFPNRIGRCLLLWMAIPLFGRCVAVSLVLLLNVKLQSSNSSWSGKKILFWTNFQQLDFYLSYAGNLLLFVLKRFLFLKKTFWCMPYYT